MKNESKVNWKLIALIAFCACVLIAVAVLVLTQVLPAGEVMDNEIEVSDDGEITVDEDEPEDIVIEDVEGNAPAGAMAALSPVEPGEKYNVLLMGVDAGGSLTDVIMIYQIDPVTESVNMLSIPRDTRVTFNGRTEKINAVHARGTQQADPQGGNRGDEYAIKFISELTGIPINHYMCINTAAFRQIIDALDGFDFNVPRNMNYDDDWQDLHIHLNAGMQHLDGDKAEQLVRFRRYTNGDIDRVNMQQQVLLALVDQKVNAEYISRVPDIFKIIKDNVSTDMSLSQTVALADDVLAAVGDQGGEVTTHIADGSFNDGSGVSYWILNTSKMKAYIRDTFGYADGQPAE